MGWPALMELARRQHGAVRSSDASACEVPASNFLRRVKQEAWPNPYPGVYVAPGAPASEMLTHWTAVLAADGYAARRSVLWLHDLGDAPDRPELVVPYGSDTRGSHTMQVRRSRTLRPAHLTMTHDMPSTTLARAAVDLAPQLRHRKLRNLVVDAERRGLLTVEEVADVRSALGRGVSGLPIVDGVLEELSNNGSDSGFEHEVRSRLFDDGFPVHPEPYPYRCDDGATVHLDIAIPTHWVYIEVDGRRFHSDRNAFTKDRAKWSQVNLHWRIVWATVDRWNDDRAGIYADLRAAMALHEATATSR